MSTATEVARLYPFLINGRAVEPERPVEVRAVADDGLTGRSGDATPAEVDRAIAAAAGARHSMARLPAWRRAQALHQLEEGVRANHEELARLVSAEAGKPIRDARRETDRALLTLHTSAEEALRIGGEIQPLDVTAGAEGRAAYIRRAPLGIIAGITPFNFPLNLVLHKVGPAIAAGNTIVIKASPRTPLTALRIGELAMACDLPPGAINVIAGGSDPVYQLLADERVAMISFTGSAAVGWKLKSGAGRKHVALELGGNAANIVHRDANLGYAASRIAAGGFGYAGQSCISAQRVFAQRAIYGDLSQKLVAAAEALRIGDPADEATDVGPMITQEAAERSLQWIHEAVKQGARLLTGGKRVGRAIAPTILENASPEMNVCREEAFAPLLVLTPYDEPADAIRMVNDSRYGLQAGLFTQDISFIMRAHREIEVGALVVNDVSTWRMDPMPYGGVKESGFGREGIRSSIESMTESRMLVLNAE